jgi:type IV pilus assembly protein PilO
MNIREPYVQKGIFGIILVGVLIWLVFFTNYLPFSLRRTSAEVQVLRDELQLVAGELQRLESAAKRLPAIKRELEALEYKWEILRGLLPKATEMSQLLSNVTTAGMRAGVQFTLFEPESPEPYDLYTRYPIRVSVTGSYHQVGRFFDNMCNMDRLVGLSDVSITQIEDGTQVATVEAYLTVSAYTYNENQAQSTTDQQTQTGQ